MVSCYCQHLNRYQVLNSTLALPSLLAKTQAETNTSLPQTQQPSKTIQTITKNTQNLSSSYKTTLDTTDAAHTPTTKTTGFTHPNPPPWNGPKTPYVSGAPFLSRLDFDFAASPHRIPAYSSLKERIRRNNVAAGIPDGSLVFM